MSEDLPILAIVGRPNTGKSTFFNRLISHRSAITENTPGITRDRNYAQVKYKGYCFILIDTGGFELNAKESLIIQMRQQAQFAVEEADAIIFIVDVQQGWTDDDAKIYRRISKAEKPIYLAVNKVDHDQLLVQTYDFYRSGSEQLYPISSEHNRGIEDLIDDVHKDIPLNKEIASKNKDAVIHVAVIGKPNVGKSSLINSILGIERMIVDPVSGTTRDPIDTYFQYQKKAYVLIDTAGIRKKGKVKYKIETYSIVFSLKAIERADVVLLVLDATEGVTDQVMKIASYAYDRHKGIILIANKWDLFKKSRTDEEEVRNEIYYQLKFVNFAPLICVSALKGTNVLKIFKLIEEVYEQYSKRIQTSDLNSILEVIVNKHNPPRTAGHATKIYYANQISVRPPTFVFMTNHPEGINSTYEKYMDSQLRHYFGFAGTPLIIIWRKKRTDSKRGKKKGLTEKRG